MNYNNLITNTIYPKSNNHLITWKKNDNIKTCDLNQNCSLIIFDITQNKNNKIINNENANATNIIDLKSMENFKSCNLTKINYFIYYKISFIIAIILLVILIYKH